MSIAICLLMITSISSSITLNAGQPQNAGQSQNIGQSGPSPTSGGSGGLADSPWPMFRHNLNHTGVSPYDTNENPGKLKWSFTTGKQIESSTAIGYDGTIYVGSHDNNLYAINPNGTEKWNFTTGNMINSSPLIDSDDTIYVGANDNKFYAIGGLSTPPTAIAGPDQTVNEGDVVQFNGSGSTPSNQTLDKYTSVRVNDDTTQKFQHHPSMIVDKNGTIHVVWNDQRDDVPYGRSGDIYFSKSTDGGKTFSSNIKINDDNTYTDQVFPDIEVDEFDKLYVVWNDYRNDPGKKDGIPEDSDIYFSCSTDRGNTWSQNVRVNDDSSGRDQRHPQIAVSNDGNIYVVWDDWRHRGQIPAFSQEIYFAKSTDGGFTFDSNIRVTDDPASKGRIQHSSTIAVDDLSNIFVAWKDQRNGNGDIYFSRSLDQGLSFEPNYRVNDDSVDAVQSGPDITTLNGIVYLTWEDQRNENYTNTDIYFAKSLNNGSTFEDNVRVNDDIPGSVQDAPSIATGLDGKLAIGWTDKRSGNFDIYMSTSNDLGDTWDSNSVISDELKSDWQSAPKVVIEEDGHIHVVYAGNIHGFMFDWDIFYAASGETATQNGNLSYSWDFDANVDSDSDGNPTNDIDATGPTPIHIYGDDGVFVVTLRVTDNDNLSALDTCNVTVQNVDPTVTIESIMMNVEIGLRVAGRKYNNVSMTLFEDGNSIGYVSIERLPGSPDEQMAWIPVSINFSKFYNATVTYTPEDPPNIGGNPVWIYIKSKDGSINKIHHTINVQQSKKRDSDHWNHMEPWEVNLNGHFIGLPFEITSHITDPGSDDEILTFTYGSQVKTVTYLNNPPNPDQYPSPEVNPVDMMDMTTLVYEGAGTVMVTVEDDDGGLGLDTLDV